MGSTTDPRITGTASAGEWVRQADWIKLPDVSGQQKFVGLHAIFADSNFISFTCAGNYTVDWGDGNTENVATGVQAYHNYAWADVSSATLTTGGYRQVVVTITPNGGNLTSIDLDKKHNQTGLNAYCTGWLDIAVAGTNITTLVPSSASVNVTHGLMERFSIVGAIATTLTTAAFYKCSRLRVFNPGAMSSASRMDSWFQSCPMFDDDLSKYNYASTTRLDNLLSSSSARNNINLTIPLVTNIGNCIASHQGIRKAKFTTSASLTTMSTVANLSANLSDFEITNCSDVTTTTNAFASAVSLRRVILTGLTIGVNVSSGCLSQTALENFFDSLGKANGAQTVTISGNYGAPTAVSLSGTTVAGSTTVTMADTTGIVNGMQVRGTGISDAVAVTFTDAGDLVTQTAHGLTNGMLVSFASITTTTGISTYTPYYVISATANDYQVSLTAGGAAIALTTNGSGTVIFRTTVVSFVTNTSALLNVPASASGTNTLTYRALNTWKAIGKGFTISG